MIQQTVPDERRGRVFAFCDVVWQTGWLVSIGVGGVLADTLDITAVYCFSGSLLFLTAMIGIVRLRTIDLPPTMSATG